MVSRYHQWYDVLFGNKDYEDEACRLLDIASGSGIAAEPRTVFDIGCGTGNHSWSLAHIGAKEVWSWDEDADMREVARAKGLTVAMPPQPVDMAIAMFHVANYCLVPAQLYRLCRTAYDNLVDGGMFLLDAWDSDAEPPAIHTSDYHSGPYRVIRTGYPYHIGQRADLVTVVNETAILQRGEQESVKVAFAWEYRHRLWGKHTIRFSLAETGFRDVTVREWGRRSVLFTAVK